MMSTPAASVLVEPLDAYLGRRARSAIVVAPGETVTVAVALLRGCRRVTGRFTAARWWLRADGCPIAVEEDEGPDAIAATAEVLERLASMASDEATRELVVRARESVLTQPPRNWDALERRFFQHAAPHPLVLGPLTPVERDAPAVDAPASTGPAARVLALVDADLADAVAEALGDLRARWRSSRAVRMGAVAAVGALVVVVGMLAWPQPPVPDASARGLPTVRALDIPDPAVSPPDQRAASVAPSTELDASPPGLVDSSKGVTANDPVAAARALFAVAGRCDAEVSCMASVVEDVGSLRDPLLPGAADADLELIEDFGGVVVVRLRQDAESQDAESQDAEMQYVTLVRQNDRWLVRAVETVADQPS